MSRIKVCSEEHPRIRNDISYHGGVPKHLYNRSIYHTTAKLMDDSENGSGDENVVVFWYRRNRPYLPPLVAD